jgi:hypothetical protein
MVVQDCRVQDVSLSLLPNLDEILFGCCKTGIFQFPPKLHVAAVWTAVFSGREASSFRSLGRPHRGAAIGPLN